MADVAMAVTWWLACAWVLIRIGGVWPFLMWLLCGAVLIVVALVWGDPPA